MSTFERLLVFHSTFWLILTYLKLQNFDWYDTLWSTQIATSCLTSHCALKCQIFNDSFLFTEIAIFWLNPTSKFKILHFAFKYYMSYFHPNPKFSKFNPCFSLKLQDFDSTLIVSYILPPTAAFWLIRHFRIQISTFEC